MSTPRRRSLAFHRDFRQLWIGDALGQTGAQLAALVLPVYAVAHLHATEWQMGALNAAQTAAFLAIGLPAGAWVDRLRKRATLIRADVVRAGVLAVVVATALTGHGSMPLLYVAALVMSAATVFFDVAHQSYVPGLVGLPNVVEGNAKLQATASIAAVGAPAVGGVLLRLLTAPLLLGATAVTYLLSALFVARIRHVETLPLRAERRPLRVEIAEGLAFVLRQPLLRRIVACTSIGNAAGAVFSAMMVIFAMRILGIDEAALGIVFSAGGAGGILGALTAERLTRIVGEGRVIALAAVAFAPAAALTPLALPLAELGVPPMVTLAAGGAAFSFAVVVYNVAQVSFRQRICPPPLLGRMNASVRFIVWGSVPLGGLAGGALGTWLGATPTLWVAVAGTLLAAIPVLMSPLIRMRDLPGAPVNADDDTAAPVT